MLGDNKISDKMHSICHLNITFFIFIDRMDHQDRFNYSTNPRQVKIIKLKPIIRPKFESSSAGNTAGDFAQRVKEVVARLGITMVQIEDWVILQRSTFDIRVNGEPYSALHLYINTSTRAYITRVWGRTHSKGNFSKFSELDEICRQSFAEGGLVCCPGHREVIDHENLLTVEYPFQRMVALDCVVLHAKRSDHGSVELCTKCIASLESQEKCVENMVEENGDPDIVEVEVEAKVHEVITVQDDETTHPEVGDGKVAENKKDVTIIQSRDDGPAEDPLEDGPIKEPFENDLVEEPLENGIDEEPLEDNIFGENKRMSSEKLRFCKSFQKPSQRINYAVLLGKKERVNRSEKPKPKKPKGPRNPLFPHIRRYPRFWKSKADGSNHTINCEHCGQELRGDVSGKRYHFIRFHNWGNFFCSQCKFFAFYPNEYAKHLLQKHPDIEDGVAATCPVCNERIPLTSNGDENDPLTEHYKECAMSSIKLRDKQNRENPALKGNQRVVCDLCGKSILGKSMPLHMETHSKREPIECSYPGCKSRCLSRHTLARHEVLVHGDQQERFHCEHCGKNIFKTKSQLNHHIRFVHEKQSQDIKCPQCDLVFTRNYLMISHRNMVHFPDKYKCGTCLKSFGGSYTLKKHCLSHQDAKNFTCDVCGKSLATASSLDEHKRTHTGEKPYLCKYCPYRGSSSSLLCHHKRQVHKAEYKKEKEAKERNRIVSGNMNEKE